MMATTQPEDIPQTIRSRCLQFHFAPVPAETIQSFLKARTTAKPAERKLAAQLSDGSPGIALELDLQESARLRRSALSLLSEAVNAGNYSEIFATTAQLAKQEKESFENILALFYSLLTDLLEYSQGPESSLPRNPDLQPELETLSKRINLDWVVRATEGLDSLESRLKRNVGRQLGLDAYVASLTAR